MLHKQIKLEIKKSIKRLQTSVILAGIGTILISPKLFHQSCLSFPRYFHTVPDPLRLKIFFLYHLILYFSVLLLVSMMGIYACERAELKPFQTPSWKKSLIYFMLGILLIPLSHFFVDHLLIPLVPELYPEKLGYALIYPFAGAFPEELIARYGFLSLLLWIYGKGTVRQELANLTVAIIFTGMAILEIRELIDSPLKPTELFFLCSGILIRHLITGKIYIKYGFWVAIIFRIGLDLRYWLYFWFFS